MSKEQLTIEHLAPYLPYMVQMYWEDFKGDKLPSYTLKPEDIRQVLEFQNKPILRPLSDLTKEIEHNGEIFIPIELIGKLFIEKGGFYEGFFGWDLPTGGDDYQDYYLTIEQKEENLWMNTWCGRPDENGYEIESHVLEYTAFFQLIKWHFDVFGLIEKGLAINLNEVK